MRLAIARLTQRITTIQTLIDLSAGRTDHLGRKRPFAAYAADSAKTAEAAEILGVAQNSLRKWAKRGDTPMHRNPANGYQLFKRSDQEFFLKRMEPSEKRLRRSH